MPRGDVKKGIVNVIKGAVRKGTVPRRAARSGRVILSTDEKRRDGKSSGFRVLVDQKGRLTDPKLSRRGNLRHLTEAVISYLSSSGEVRLTDLQRAVNAGSHGLLNLKRALARGKLRLLTFLRLFGETFVVQNGRVRLKTQAPAPSAAPVESAADRRYREFKEREARQERERAAKRAAAAERVRGLEGVYGRGLQGSSRVP